MSTTYPTRRARVIAGALSACVATAAFAPLAVESAGASNPTAGVVYAAAPSGVTGFESSMAFSATTDPTLLTQLDNQQGSDADSTMYSQAFQIPTDSRVTSVSWWGTASGETGFMVAIHDGVWPISGSTATLPNGPVVNGTLSYLGVVPTASVATSPALNGETKFTLAIPATAMFASHAYRLSVTAVGGNFEWDTSSAAGCCTGTQAIQWVRGRLKSYLSATNVSFSLGATTSVVVNFPATTPVSGQRLSLTSSVTLPGAPAINAGTLTLYDGAKMLSVATVTSGSATFHVALTAGTHHLTATYVGTAQIPSATSAITTLVVARDATTTSAALPATVGVHRAFSVTVAVTTTLPGTGVATGAVTLRAGATLLATSKLTGTGKVSLRVKGLAKGTYSLTLSYAGDVNHAPSSAPLAVSVH